MFIKLWAIFSDCGGYVMNFGGAITMMNMASETNNATIKYDCIWIIQPPQDYAFKSHLSIRIEQFEAMGKYSIKKKIIFAPT